MRKNFVQALVLALMVGAGAVTTFSVAVPTQAQDAKVPTTVEDHLALAKMYEDKEASYRKEADYHHQMFEAYKKGVASSPKAPNPWVAKMQRHCQQFARDAEKLADDAHKAAEYHRLRAKELQGQ